MTVSIKPLVIVEPRKTLCKWKHDETKLSGDDIEMADQHGSMIDMDSEGVTTLVTPGQLITDDMQYMRGHGTYVDPLSGQVKASVAGCIERVNKLIIVNPLYTRYLSHIGDLVVGRIAEVGQNRWRVDIGSRQDAVLMLSSINLPGGVLRRKSESDELRMRTFFKEGDLLVSEVQSQFQDGAVSIHTRSLKYGKLRNGHLVTAPPRLIVRSKQHVFTAKVASVELSIVLGVNGRIWIAKHVEELRGSLGDEASEEIYSDHNDHIDDGLREAISRVALAIEALIAGGMHIDEKAICVAAEASLAWENANELMLSENQARLCSQVLQQCE